MILKNSLILFYLLTLTLSSKRGNFFPTASVAAQSEHRAFSAPINPQLTDGIDLPQVADQTAPACCGQFEKRKYPDLHFPPCFARVNKKQERKGDDDKNG